MQYFSIKSECYIIILNKETPNMRKISFFLNHSVDPLTFFHVPMLFFELSRRVLEQTLNLRLKQGIFSLAKFRDTLSKFFWKSICGKKAHDSEHKDVKNWKNLNINKHTIRVYIEELHNTCAVKTTCLLIFEYQM